VEIEMIEHKNRHSRLFRTIAIGVVCLFLLNTTFQGISYADIHGNLRAALAVDAMGDDIHNDADLEKLISENVLGVCTKQLDAATRLKELKTWVRRIPHRVKSVKQAQDGYGFVFVLPNGKHLYQSPPALFADSDHAAGQDDKQGSDAEQGPEGPAPHPSGESSPPAAVEQGMSDVPSGETPESRLHKKLSGTPLPSPVSAYTVETLVRASFDLVRKIRKQNYNAIIISGYSSEISRILLTRAWARLFPPEVQMPPLYILSGRTNHIIYRAEEVHSVMYSLPEKIDAFKGDMGDETGEVFERLKTGKVLHLDDHSGKGRKIGQLERLFYERAGFRNVHHGAFVASERIRSYEGRNVIIGAFDERATLGVRALAGDISNIARSEGEDVEDAMVARVIQSAKETNDMALEALTEFVDQVDLRAIVQEHRMWDIHDAYDDEMKARLGTESPGIIIPRERILPDFLDRIIKEITEKTIPGRIEGEGEKAIIYIGDVVIAPMDEAVKMAKMRPEKGKPDSVILITPDEMKAYHDDLGTPNCQAQRIVLKNHDFLYLEGLIALARAIRADDSEAIALFWRLLTDRPIKKADEFVRQRLRERLWELDLPPTERGLIENIDDLDEEAYIFLKAA